MAAMPTRDQILEALKVVIDPELRRDIVELDMVRSIEIKDGGTVDVTVSLTTPGCPIKNHFETAVAGAVRGIDGVTHVNVGFDVLTDQQKAGLQRKLGRPGGLPERALYRVRFVQSHVWPDYDGAASDTIDIDLYEHWLQPVDKS